jgi:hypothetical protein
MLSFDDLRNIYDTWKKAKGAGDRIEKSGLFKVLKISNRVDQLIREYQDYRKDKSAKALASIRARLTAIKQELAALAASVPPDPVQKYSKGMGVKYAEAVLEAKINSEAGQMELTRVYLDQLQGRLPDEDIDDWPATRARFVNARDTFRRASVGQSSIAVSVQKDIDAEEEQQSELGRVRDHVRREPGITDAESQVEMLYEQYQESERHEAELKEQLRSLHAGAEAFATVAAKLDVLIEAGDLISKEKKKK